MLSKKALGTPEKPASELERQRALHLADAVLSRTPSTEDIRRKVANPLLWMQGHTKTKDSHWREHRVESPYRRFPDWPYLRVLLEDFQRDYQPGERGRERW